MSVSIEGCGPVPTASGLPSASQAGDEQSNALDRTWRVKVENMIYGPYSGDHMRRYIDEGRIIPESIVKPVGGGRWRAAGTDPILQSLFPSSSSPDALSQTSHDSERSGEAPKPVDGHAEALAALAPRVPMSLSDVMDRVRAPDDEDAPMAPAEGLDFDSMNPSMLGHPIGDAPDERRSQEARAPDGESRRSVGRFQEADPQQADNGSGIDIPMTLPDLPEADGWEEAPKGPLSWSRRWLRRVARVPAQPSVPPSVRDRTAEAGATWQDSGSEPSTDTVAAPTLDRWAFGQGDGRADVAGEAGGAGSGEAVWRVPGADIPPAPQSNADAIWEPSSVAGTEDPTRRVETRSDPVRLDPLHTDHMDQTPAHQTCSHQTCSHQTCSHQTCSHQTGPAEEAIDEPKPETETVRALREIMRDPDIMKRAVKGSRARRRL